MLSVHRATCSSSQVHRRAAAVPLPAGLKRSPLLLRRHTPITTQCISRSAAVRPRALFYPSGGSQNQNRIAAAPPQARQALLSSAISSCRDWRQLGSLVEAYGPYLSPNNISHCLTRLEQVLAAQQLTAGEAEQVEVLLEWLLRRGREMNATAQLGPQALGATAGALARLQEAQRQQQQQQLACQRQQQQQQQARSVRERVLEEEEAKRADAVADRRQLMQQLVDAAVAQRSRLSPQALNDVLSGLASIDESGMSADEIRQLLNIPTQQQPRSRQAAAAAASIRPASLAEQQAQQMQRRQQQQQQRVVGPAELQKTARQLGQLSPELAQEWHDRALRQSLDQGALPPGIDQRYLSGFLAREIDRAAERARDTNTTSSSRAAAPSGAALLQAVLSRYGQLPGVAHCALAGHRLAELQQEGLAGTQQEVEAVASRLFQLSQARMPSADAASLSSLISSCKELRLYSENLLSAALARAKALLQAQLQGSPGFSARQLGVVLHSLAVLGLKPSDGWLRLAVVTAGQLLPSCSLTDLERLASSLVLMRTAPGREWTAAAEAQLEQLAAAIGSSAADSARARALVGEDGESEEADEGEEAVDAAASNARKALVACVKSLALLGGQRATAWYRNIVAEEEARKQQQEQEERLRQQREAAAAKQQQQQQLLQQQEQQRQREIERQRQRQQELQQQRQAPAATSEDLLKRQLRKAMAQQQQQRGRAQEPFLQQQQQNATSGSSGSNRELTALSSLDDMMSRALQQPDTTSSSSSAQQSSLPHATTSIAEATGSASSEQPSGATTPTTSKTTTPSSSNSSSNSSSSSSSSGSGKKAGKQSSAPGRVEAAAPAAWAAEQTARWADTEGEQSPAAELQQQLDDSQEMFGPGSSSSSSSRDSRRLQQQGQQQGAGKAEARDADAAQEIQVEFAGDSSSTQPGQQQQQRRSAADAASALAAMMAEVDQQEVDVSAQQEVMRELGLGPDGQAIRPEGQASSADGGDYEGVMSLQEIQAAADAVQQATQQLDELEQRQQQQQAAAQQQQQQKEQEQHSRLQSKHRKHKQKAAASAARAAAAAAKRRPLGSSGEAAFVAAAKNLSSGRPSRNYLLGCLEAIDMQQQQLKQQLAEKQALAAVAGAAQRQRAAAALDANPLAKKIAQLQQDFDNARKRAADEKSAVTATAVADVASKLLPLLDSFDAAFAAQLQLQQQDQGGAAAREAEQIHTVYTGLHNQLLSILKAQGVTVIGEGDDVVGQAFDPSHMEAVMRQPAPAGVADGDVLQVLRKGYAVGERLVRPALVIVAYED